MLIKILIASIISGILYRLGGTSRGTKWRDFGCPTVALVALWLLVGFKSSYWWAYLLFFGFSFASLTTYWDFIPFNKGEDNHFMHGFFCGLAGIPLIWVGIPLWIILARLTLCTLGMGLWSKWIGNAVVEETGRCVLFII